ncbi:MAG: hypothetical protein Q8L79_12685 [Methylobacter sp.]|uniref:hypothetical protein n=1 Tax=Methylobacter sp. TaxID=2051955 RepID=UPI00273137E5|nr:hypothetical protein [Methylobacter sp.]MDP1665968.1 hypothetical protein [Methylobacter sp.]
MRLKARLQLNDPLYGLFCSTPAALSVELIAAPGPETYTRPKRPAIGFRRRYPIAIFRYGCCKTGAHRRFSRPQYDPLIGLRQNDEEVRRTGGTVQVRCC